jgi:hypothetical protein
MIATSAKSQNWKEKKRKNTDQHTMQDEWCVDNKHHSIVLLSHR